MATTKVSELTELTSADNADLLLIADTSANQSKKITKANLISGLATTTYVDSQVATKDALSELSGTSDDITEGTTNLFFTSAEQTKLSGIETGATADQTAQEIATAIDADATAETTLKSALGLGTAAYTASTDYATAAQGTTADSALQDITEESVGDLSDVTITSATSGQVLKYNGTAWVNDADTDTDTGILNVVEDTTPQLGGDLDTNGNDVNFGDNDKAQFGASSDLQIYHDGSNSYISDQGTGHFVLRAGDLRIQNPAGTESYLIANENGGVNLYYDNSSKLLTTSTGVDVTGTVTVDGITNDGNISTDTARSADIVDNDGSFDLDAGTNFTCTPTGNITLTFTNIPDGQSGTIVLVNTGGHTISAASTTKVMGADMLTTITTAGTYVIGYISDGTNVRVYNSLAQQ